MARALSTPWRARGLGLLSALLLSACGGGDDVHVVERIEAPAQAVVLAGRGEPSDASGQDGQFYLDTETSLLYGPRSGGAWPRPARSVMGAAGPQGTPGAPGGAGAKGADGADGANGTNGLNGTNGTNGTNGVDGQDGTPGAPGAQGPAGPSSAQFQWSVPSNTGFGLGSYYLWPQGPNAVARNPVLLPQACTQARLQVATLAVLNLSASYSFAVKHTVGPDLPADVHSDLPLSCTLSGATGQRSCDLSAAVNLKAGDAIEVWMAGNQAITDLLTPGSTTVAFSCQ